MNIEWLKRKELGLPLYAWIGISAVVIFFGYKYLKNRGAGSASTTPAATATDSTAQDGMGSAGGGDQPPDLTNPDNIPSENLIPGSDSFPVNQPAPVLPGDTAQTPTSSFSSSFNTVKNALTTSAVQSALTGFRKTGASTPPMTPAQKTVSQLATVAAVTSASKSLPGPINVATLPSNIVTKKKKLRPSTALTMYTK